MAIAITNPTIITEAQYNGAFIAVTRSNADVYLLWDNGTKCLWLGRDEANWDDFNPYTNPNCEVSEESVIDDTGTWVDVECFVCPTEKCLNRLDLDLLAEGKISWI